MTVHFDAKEHTKARGAVVTIEVKERGPQPGWTTALFIRGARRRFRSPTKLTSSLCLQGSVMGLFRSAQHNFARSTPYT